MTHPRKTQARSSTRNAKEAGRRFTPAGVESALRLVGICLGVVLVLTAGWRWYRAALDTPLQVIYAEEPTAVLVVQAGDCPDRRAAMEDWIQARTHDGRVGEMPLQLAILDRDERAQEDLTGAGSGVLLGESLGRLPALPPDEARRAGRALLRSGARGTPALLLLDGAGRPMLASTFTATGPGPGLADLTAVAQALAPSARPGVFDSRSQETDPWNH